MDTNFVIEMDIPDKNWDTFVSNHPHGNIFQTASMYDVYKKTKNYTPIKLCIINKTNEEMFGLMSAVIIREYSNVLSRFTARSIIQGGPLLVDTTSKEMLSMLMSEYANLVKNKALYTQIRNLFKVNDYFNCINGYKFEDHLNFLINLDQSEKELWGLIHKDRRKNINRSINRGVIIEEMKDKLLMPIFYDLLKETYNNVKVPLADISLFEAAFDILVPKKMATFFMAKYNEKYIGARVVLTYKDIVYDWYAGASIDSLSLYPNEHLVWHILKWGGENDYKVFDFGGAGKPDIPYGPREFKRRFGGELVNFGWYEYVHAPIATYAVINSFKMYQKLKTLSEGISIGDNKKD